MLHINDEKSEWNLSETHILIPMIDGDVTCKESEKILTSTLTLSSLEGGDQAILANTLEHSFVIGFDKNLFETPTYKSDLVIIQNSDLKLHSGNTDLKNSVAYALSYANQDKSEILWQGTVPKHKICASDKEILEIRDVSNYDNSVQGQEKNEQQIDLINGNPDFASQVVKNNDEILIEKTINDEKNINKAQFISYFEGSQNTEVVPNLQQLDVSKLKKNLGLEEKKLLDYKCHSNSNVQDIYKLGENAQGIIFHVTDSAVEFNESQSINLVKYNKASDKIKIITKKIRDARTENTEVKETNEKGSNSLPEKSLPLKKKAKMKRTLTPSSSENQKSLLKQDMVNANQEININISAGKKVKQPLTNNNFQEEKNQSSLDEPLINKVSKRRKIIKLKNNPRKFKMNTGYCLQEGATKSKKFSSNINEVVEGTKIEVCGFDENKFSNVNDLIDCLRKCRMISATVWQTLNSGLKEMKMDILKEMNAKKNEKYIPESANYSPQLKAFALVLYFKQPAAFNYLSQVYKNGWPSLNVIKKWKRRMNSCQRPNFIKMENFSTSNNLK